MLIKYLFVCGNPGGPWQLRALVHRTPYTHLGTALVIPYILVYICKCI